jgi:broad specificity phosphatase PhoE
MDALPEKGEATRLLLVRHAEPDGSAHGRCCGRLDVPLSDYGRRHAKALAAALERARLAAVYASPLARALETARPLAAVRGLEVSIQPDLSEVDFGELEGKRYEEVAAERPGLFRMWMDEPAKVRFPGGESLAELRARVLAASEEIRRAHRGEAVAVVAHAGVVRVVLADALGLRDSALFRLDVAYGGISIVDWVEHSPVVRAVNLYSAP